MIEKLKPNGCRYYEYCESVKLSGLKKQCMRDKINGLETHKKNKNIRDFEIAKINV